MEGYSIQAVISSLLLNMLNIVALFLILRALVYKPVRKYLKERSDRIQGEMDAAKARQAEADALHETYTAELTHAKEDANAQANEILAKAEDMVHAMQLQAQSDAEQVVAHAREQVDREHEDAMVMLRREVADISVDIATRVLEREITQKDNGDLIDSYFDQLNGQNGVNA